MANLATATCEAERQTGQAPIVDMLKPVARQQVCVAGNVGSVVDHAGGDAVGLQLAHQLLRVVLRRPCADQFVERVMCRMACSGIRSEEHTSELQSLMRISYAVFCLKKKIKNNT